MQDDARPSPANPSCHACDYDLTGTVRAGVDRCPECGDPFDSVAMERARERRAFRRVRRWVWILAALAILMAAATYLLLSDHAVLIAPLVVFAVAPLAPVLLAWAAGDR